MARPDPNQALFEWFRAKPWEVWAEISLQRDAPPARGAASFIAFMKQAARKRSHLHWGFVVGMQPVRDVIHFHGAGFAAEARAELIVVPESDDELKVRAAKFEPGRRSVEYLAKHGVIHHGIYCPRMSCRRRGCRYERPPGVSEILEHLR